MIDIQKEGGGKNMNTIDIGENEKIEEIRIRKVAVLSNAAKEEVLRKLNAYKTRAIPGLVCENCQQRVTSCSNCPHRFSKMNTIYCYNGRLLLHLCSECYEVVSKWWNRNMSMEIVNAVSEDE